MWLMSDISHYSMYLTVSPCSEIPELLFIVKPHRVIDIIGGEVGWPRAGSYLTISFNWRQNNPIVKRAVKPLIVPPHILNFQALIVTIFPMHQCV